MAASPLSTRSIARVFFTVLGFTLVVYLAYLVRSTLVLLFIGVFLAVALGPPVDFFSRRARLPRSGAILLVYLLIAAVIFGVGLLVVPPVVDQVQGLSDEIPHYLDDLRKNKTFRDYDEKYDITQKLNEQARTLPARLGDAVGALQSVTVGVFSAALKLVTVLTITFFLLLDGGRIADFLFGALGPEREDRFRTIANDVYRAVGGYVAGALSIALLAGTTTYIMLHILNVPFATPLAVLMTFFDLIPLIGATIGGILIGLVTLTADFPGDAIVWVIFLIVYQQFENSVIQPNIYKRTVNVPPLAVITAILIGASLLGVLGALVAIPLAATAQIIARDWWRTRQGRRPPPTQPLVPGDPLDGPPDDDPPGRPPPGRLEPGAEPTI